MPAAVSLRLQHFLLLLINFFLTVFYLGAIADQSSVIIHVDDIICLLKNLFDLVSIYYDCFFVAPILLLGQSLSGKELLVQLCLRLRNFV